MTSPSGDSPVIEASATGEPAQRPRPRSLGATLVGDRLVDAPQGHGHWRSDSHARLDRAIEALRRLAEVKISTVVDTTTLERGRDLDLIREASAATGVTVLPCTGLDAEASGVASVFRGMPATQLADFLIADLEQTAGLTLAGGSDAGGFDERAALAIAFAYAETGAPVIVETDGPARVDQLVARGVDPERILAAGLDGIDASFAKLDAIADRDVVLGFTSSDLPHDARATLIAYALRRYGPERVCVGTGEVAERLAAGPDGWLASVGNGQSALSLSQLANALESFGVGRDLMHRALEAGAGALFAGGTHG